MDHWIEQRQRWAIELVGEGKLLGHAFDASSLLFRTKREASAVIRLRSLRGAKPVRVWVKYERV